MSGPDGAEQRTADLAESHERDLDRLDLDEQRADEAFSLTATERGLAGSAVVLQLQRDHLADTLRDLALGAQMMLEPALQASGTFKQYAEEVLRVARAGLKEYGAKRYRCDCT